MTRRAGSEAARARRTGRIDLRTGKRRTVAGRILASYLVVMGAFALTVGYSVASARRAARDAELLRSGYVPLKLSIGAALETQNLVSAQLNHITEAKNPSDARGWIETERRVRPLTFADIRSAATNGLAPAADPHAIAFGADLLREGNDIERYLASDGDRFGRLFDAIVAGDVDRAEHLRGELVSYEVEGARRLRELLRRVDREMDELVGAARARERRAIEMLLVLAALTLVVGLAVSLYARRVLAPLGAVTARAKAVAEGDLTPRDVVASPDEIGELATTFEGMVAAIARANAELVQAERLATIGKMAAKITHEIRNPLSSIGLNVELLEEELAQKGDPKESQQLLRAIKGEVERLAGLSEEYLRVARRPVPRLEKENLGDLVRELVEFVRPELERARVKSAIELAEPLPPVAFDEGQIRQALLNLVRNAREAMQPDGGELRIAIRAAAGGGLDLVVEDTGGGIPDEAREKIFDPFFTTKERGTGLGLSVTRQIVEAHGGAIACEARSPRGTRFWIHLPGAD